MKNKKGFTLIELVAVLVILAILALIVTPLVLNIIRKARTSADKRSIDAYGRSIELAVADYLLDKGTFPTSIEQLTIEYSGDEVVCETTQLNPDSSVYLAGCTVGGRSVDYIYGKEETVTYKAYSIGDEVTYNNVDYYVIKDSTENESTVTLLKAEPLTVDEVNIYGAGHVNRYTPNSVGTAKDINGYGGMEYYTSETCGYVNNNWTYNGCTSDYTQSDIKYAVDAWKVAQAPAASEASLITINDLKDNLGYVLDTEATTETYIKSENTPSWVYNSNYYYWTISPYSDSSFLVWLVNSSGSLSSNGGYGSTHNDGVVRPVIVLSKTALK